MALHEVKSDMFVMDQNSGHGGFGCRLRELFNVLGRCDPDLTSKIIFGSANYVDLSIDRRRFPLSVNENSSYALNFISDGSEMTPIILGGLAYSFEDPEGRRWEFTETQSVAYQADKSNKGGDNFVYTLGGVLVPNLNYIKEGAVRDLPKLAEVLAHSGQKRDLIRHLEIKRGIAPVEFLIQGVDMYQVTREADMSLYEGLGNNAELFGLKPVDNKKRDGFIENHKKKIWGRE